MHITSLRCIRSILRLACGAALVAGCGSEKAAGPTSVAERYLPPFAMAATPHVGSLTAHSFAREGYDDSPDVSPDGMWMVFVSTRNSLEPQIYRQTTSGSVVTQLTPGTGGQVQPAISPDGAEIAFASNEDGQWDIWIMPAAGGGRENLTSTRDLNEVHPTWHPRGRLIAYSALRPQDNEWWVCAKARGASGVSWLAPGLNPQWSPKGDKIVFQRPKDRGRRQFGIWTVDVDVDAGGIIHGSAQSQLVSDNEWSAIEPAFSPDGGRIAFIAVPAPGSPGASHPIGGDIWCVRTDGTDLVRLTSSPEPEWRPRWSSLGRVYFVSERSGYRNIWSLMPSLGVGQFAE